MLTVAAEGSEDCRLALSEEAKAAAAASVMVSEAAPTATV